MNFNLWLKTVDEKEPKVGIEKEHDKHYGENGQSTKEKLRKQWDKKKVRLT